MAKQSIRLSDHFTYGKLLRFTLPSICMMVFTSIYGVVDGLFVSNFVGKTPFAAVNLVMPFVMILGGMGFMIGTGGTALVSKLLGEGKQDEAHRTFSMLVLFTLLLGAVLSAVGIITMPAVSRLLGASDAMMPDCVLYGRIVTGFTFAFMLQNVFQSFFIAAEKPRLGLFVTVAAGVTNMVLDALFIAVFDWGVAGAAIATGLSQCVGGVLPLIYFLRPNTSLLRLRPAALRLRPILQSCGNGSSELMSNISSSLVGMLYNFQLMRLIGEDGVSAYGVLMYVQFIFVAIFIGYSIGSAPVVSFHYGAQHHSELKNLLRKSALLMAIGGVTLTVAGPCAGRPPVPAVCGLRCQPLRSDHPCLPAVLLVVPTGRLQHLRLRLLHRPEQRCRLRCHLLPADAGVPSRLRRHPAHTSGRGRYLVGHHRRRDLCLYHLRRLSGAQAE